MANQSKGTQMAQFPMNDARKPILEKIPDYAVAMSAATGRVIVTCRDTVIVDTKSALLVQETRHADVYYLPRKDVNMSLLAATDLSTYCPFKGHASYWSLTNGGPENFVWRYEAPYPEVAELKDYLSFYTDKVEQIVS